MKSTYRLAGFVCWSLMLVASARAEVIYSTGFESPTFSAYSQLQGQDGWTPAGSLPPFLSTNAAVITRLNGGAGGQAVVVRGDYMTSAAQVAPYAAVGSYRRPVDYDTNASGLKIVRLSVDVMLTGPTTVPFTGWAASLAARDSAGFTLAELEIGADGSLAGFGNQAPGSTPLVSGSTTPGGWHKLGLEIDYNTNLSRFFVDDNQLGSAISFASSNPSGILARGALVAYAGPDVSDQFTRADHAIYFDNYSVSAVPEPSTFVLAGFGLAAVGLYVSKKKQLVKQIR